MNEINMKAYAKINLSIDVIGKRTDGYHDVRMVMQQIDLCDIVNIRYVEKGGSGLISISTDSDDLPADGSNIAWKAAALMRGVFPDKGKGDIVIHIEKRIPIAAGLAGGSADAAAVLHGLNTLWGCGLSVSELIELGVRLGADVPFCLMGQAAANFSAGSYPHILWPSGEAVSTCALAEGIGEILTPLTPLKAFLILSKPDISVVTANIYGSLNMEEISRRPDTPAIIHGLQSGDFHEVKIAMYNVLEEVSTRKYPIIQKEIQILRKVAVDERVMMSGSGPTVFALISDEIRARTIFNKYSELKIAPSPIMSRTLFPRTSIPLS